MISTFLQSWSQGVDVWGESGMRKLFSTANVFTYGGNVKEENFLKMLSGLIGQYRYTSVALRNSERLLQLVADLLSISTAGKILEPQSVDLAQLIRASITSAAPRAKAGNVVIRPDLPSAVPAEVDPLRIGQVLDNLLSNAIKFSPEGGTVTVSARRTEEHIVMEVSDTGIGMAPEEAREAFTKFFRADTALKAAIPGAGLGPAITRNIIHAHQGTITLSSEPGQGTTVTVTLPARN